MNSRSRYGKSPFGTASDRLKIFRLLFENNPLPMWVYDLETLRFLEVNEAAVKSYGYSREEFLQMKVTDIRPQQDLSQLIDGLQGQWAELEHSGGWQHRRKDGTLVDVEIASQLIETNGRQAALIVAHDVTERNRVEAMSHERQAQLIATIETAMDAVIILDDHQRIVLFNSAAEKIFRCLASEAIGQSIELFIPPHFRVAHREYVDAFGRNGETRRHDHGPDSVNLTALRVDGEEFPAEISISKFESSGRKFYTAIVRDITKRKQAEEALLRSEERYRLLAEAAHDMIFIINRQGEVEYANRYAADQFHRKPQELIGVSIKELLPELVKEERLKEVEKALKRGKEMYFERQVPFPDRTPWLGTSLVPLHNESNQMTGVLGVARDITQRKEVEEQIQRHVSELEALYDSGLALSQTLDPKTIGNRLIEILAERLDWDHAAVRLRGPDSDAIELLAFSGSHTAVAETDLGELRARSTVAKVGQGLAGWVIENGQAVRSGNLELDGRYVPTFSGMHSGLYIPMKIGEITIGCVSVESPQLEAFGESDERLVSTLAAQAAVAIEKARLFDQTIRRLDQVMTLRQIDKVITSSTDLRTTLGVVLDLVTAQLSVDAALVLLLEPDMLMLNYALGRGFRSSKESRVSLRLGESQAGRAALERRTIYIPNMETATFSQADLLDGEEFVAYACVPLIAKGEVKGVLEIFHRAPLHPDEEWFDYLNVLAGQIAIAVDNSTMFDHLQRSNLELSLAYEATIEGWSRALDLRDRDTEGHTQRVTDLAVRLARELGYSNPDIAHLRRGGLLHDIGKVGIPDIILNKPGPLTPEEWEIMRCHPQYAYDMLMPIAYLRRAIDIPYCHHERWDGSGYPRGIKGETIPLSARIFAVADVYDALTSDRPYRKAWSVEKTIAYLREQSGSHFDPHIVDVFLTKVLKVHD